MRDHRGEQTATVAVEKTKQNPRQYCPGGPNEVPAIRPDMDQPKGQGRNRDAKLGLHRTPEKHLLAHAGEHRIKTRSVTPIRSTRSGANSPAILRITGTNQ